MQDGKIFLVELTTTRYRFMLRKQFEIMLGMFHPLYINSQNHLQTTAFYHNLFVSCWEIPSAWNVDWNFNRILRDPF